KIIVCHSPGHTSTIQIDPSAAPAHLAHGDMLGGCQSVSPAVTSRMESQNEVVAELRVMSIPNPSTSSFILSLKGGNTSEKINIRIADISGRTVEEKKSVSSNSNVTLGSSYLPGIYFAEVIQGAVHKQLKLVKL
ncbi:MAG: T9SS type A sorting domain-containing protein, partial [Flavisolibacter sp.]